MFSEYLSLSLRGCRAPLKSAIQQKAPFLHFVILGKVPKTPRGGGVHKMGGGQMIFPKNGGSVDAIDDFWGE